jgi:hypothetical protein
MLTDEELSCQQVVELVTDYLESALLPGMRKRLEAHVAGCPSCENYLEQMQLTIDMLHHIARASVFPATKRELLRFFRDCIKVQTSDLDVHCLSRI